MGYDFCLFDLDGTLTDPKEGITKSFQYALASFGIYEELENLTPCIGPPLRESFSKLFHLSDSDTEKAVEKYREYFAKEGLYQNTVYPDIPETLKKLKENGKVLALATNKATVYASQILKHFNLNGYFSYVSGDEFDGRNSKNGKAKIIQIALENLGVTDFKKAVMIGDRRHDIIGANEVGLKCIGILWGYGSKEELLSAGASYIADSVDTLLSLII